LAARGTTILLRRELKGESMIPPTSQGGSPKPADGSAPQGRGRGTRQFVFALLTILGTSIICLLLAEGTVRVLKRDVPFQPDPELIRSLRPNVRQSNMTYDTEENLNGRSIDIPSRPLSLGVAPTNAQGLRMQEDVGPKQANEGRILFFGDSYTEGLGVRSEERFAEILDKRVRGLNGVKRKWRVINAGIQNGNPSQYILQATRYLLEFGPDIVVVFLAPNDVVDDLGFEYHFGYVFDEKGFPTSPRAKLQLWLLQKSYLLRYFEVFLNRVGPRAHDFVFRPAAPELVVPDLAGFICKGDPAAQALFRNKTGRYLERLKQMSEAAGAKFAVHLIQYKGVFVDEPVYEPRYGMRKYLEGCYSSAGRPYNEFIEAFLKDKGIAFRNPYDAFLKAKAENPKRQLWLFWDYHYSPAGHQVAADDLYELVRPMLD
jgi:hypothetical protein